MPDFALDLAHDGIRLLTRDGDGWIVLDAVGLEDPNLSDRMRGMRAAAVARAGEDFETALIIPPSQIRYTKVTLPESLSRVRDSDIASALDGLTAVPLDELVFDWRREGQTARVAMLDAATLDEAEEFAVSYGLNPVGFTARPDSSQFPDAPDFGPTQFARHRAEPSEDSAVFATKRATDTEPQAQSADIPEESEAEAPPSPRNDPPKEPKTKPVAVAAPGLGNRPSPWAALTGKQGPGLAILVVAAVTAALIWTAYALLTPDEPEEVVLPVPEATPETAEATPAPSPGTVVAPEPVPSAEPPRSIAVIGPLTPAEPDITREDMAARADVPLLSPDPEAYAEDRELPPPIDYAELSAAAMWQTPPPPIRAPAPTLSDEIYVASVDPVIFAGDAFALSAIERDTLPTTRPGPLPAPNQAFDLDERGLVRATPDGAVTPNWITVTEGSPDVVPPTRPETLVPDTNAAVAAALEGFTPRARPDGLLERNERARLGGRSLEELAALRPSERPESAQSRAISQSEEEGPTEQAVARSLLPSDRPDDFADTVATARTREAASASTQVASAGAVATATPQPNIPTSASVARQATIESAINLRRLNLIGVYGSDNDRRALLRLPSGRYIKVKVGDRVDGGQVAAIGDGELRYVKGGRNVTLKVPSG